MADILILALVGLTTAGAYLVGRRGFGFSKIQLWPAVAGVLDGIGMGLIFFAMNILAGALLILAMRRLTGKFVSIYLLQDLSMLVLSLLQGLAFQFWQESPPGLQNSSPEGTEEHH